MEISVGSKNFVAGAPYRSAAFSSQSSVDLVLRLFVSPSQIDFFITGENHRVLFLQPYQNNTPVQEQSILNFLSEVLSSDEVLRNFKGKKKVGIANADFTLFPEKFSDPSIMEEWKNRFTSNATASDLCIDTLESLVTKVAYTVPLKILDILKGSLHEFTLHHTITRQLKTLAKENQGTTVYCIVQSGFLQIIVLQEQELLFANIFSYQSAQDFIYYLLAVYHQYALDPETIRLKLSGEIVKDSALFQLVYKYIRHIEFGRVPASFRFDDDYPFPPHFYFSLYSL